ncbi:putative integrase core domain protein [Rhizophagus irregularis DAOM 181602=DAOM 197198]|nr:putative integrase core domain protein [Rhizophagus irregularis DAOM 181602=DAOM 197198]
MQESESPNVSNIQLEPEKVVPIGKLEESQYQLLHQLLDKNKDLFAKSLQTPEGEHIIITEEVPPIKKRVYRTAPKKNEFIESEINVMFCINYKPLNDITKKDNYPLPRIDELLDSLQNAQWFTTLDLASGYWQIKVRAEDQEKTAFITKFGTYEFKEKFILVYHDDVIIYSKTFKDHIQHLEEVLNRIRKANLRLKAKKCHFAVAELQFLRYIVRKKGVKPDPEKVNKMVNYLEPQNIRELRRILGLFSYYQRFIKDFAKVADPMYKLLKKDAPYKWMNLQQKAFENLKDKLITAPIVQYPDFSKPFFLYTNASIIGLGAVLAQKTDDQEYVIAHASRTLIPAEKNYAITELECLAIENKGWYKKSNSMRTSRTHFISLSYRYERCLFRNRRYNWKIKDRYYWPQLEEDVKEYIRTCDICQRRGPTNRRKELIPILVKGPFYRIGIDIKGPLPITNRGTSFMNKLIDELCENYQTKHRLTSAYRSQTNGIVERFNQTIGECIAKLVQDNNKEWDQLIDAVLLVYRTKKHNTTEKTPFYLTYGREATLPIDLKIPSQISQNEKDPMQKQIYQLIVELEEERNDVSLRIEKEQTKQKQVYDQQGISEKLKIGDQVLVE